MDTDNDTTDRGPENRGFLERWRVTLVVAAVVIAGLALFGFATTPAEKTAPTGPGSEPLQALTTPVTIESGYLVAREFIGRVEARRESDVGFELGGQVAEVHAEEGENVERGELVARLDTRRLEARRSELAATVEQARTALELAEITRSRVREASDLNAVAPQTRDEAELDVMAKAAALERARAGLEAVEVDLEKSRLRAPFDAVVARRFLDEGQVINAGQPVLKLLERTNPEVRIGVAGGAVSALEAGQSHELEVSGQQVPATLRAVLPVRERGTRSVDAIFTLHTELDGIRSGDLARLEIERRIEEAGTWLPTSALTEGRRGLWAVYVAPGEPGQTTRLERRDVELLHQEGERAFVRGTLEAGERVVLEGLHRLVTDQEVTISKEDGR